MAGDNDSGFGWGWVGAIATAIAGLAAVFNWDKIKDLFSGWFSDSPAAPANQAQPATPTPAAAKPAAAPAHEEASVPTTTAQNSQGAAAPAASAASSGGKTSVPKRFDITDFPQDNASILLDSAGNLVSNGQINEGTIRLMGTYGGGRFIPTGYYVYANPSEYYGNGMVSSVTNYLLGNGQAPHALNLKNGDDALAFPVTIVGGRRYVEIPEELKKNKDFVGILGSADAIAKSKGEANGTAAGTPLTTVSVSDSGIVNLNLTSLKDGKVHNYSVTGQVISQDDILKPMQMKVLHVTENGQPVLDKVFTLDMGFSDISITKGGIIPKVGSTKTDLPFAQKLGFTINSEIAKQEQQKKAEQKRREEEYLQDCSLENTGTGVLPTITRTGKACSAAAVP